MDEGMVDEHLHLNSTKHVIQYLWGGRGGGGGMREGGEGGTVRRAQYQIRPYSSWYPYVAAQIRQVCRRKEPGGSRLERAYQLLIFVYKYS